MSGPRRLGAVIFARDVDHGLCVMRDDTGQRVVAWSTLDARPSEPYLGGGITVRDDGGAPGVAQAAMLLPAVAVVAALRGLGPAERAVVLGDAPLAPIVSRALTDAGTHVVPAPVDGLGVDLLVDVGGDVLRWTRALSSVRGEGTTLVMVAPWARPTDLNLYRGIHEASLRLVARRWDRPPPGVDDMLGAAIGPAADGAAHVEPSPSLLPLDDPSPDRSWVYEWPA